ncbi:dipeptide epimerase [Microtetraspora sp. NBRC 16547]|uniref:mandelate racemase/muconate lactonizing enzyme family protein n=1 Tax=Microtetraspora sp. NBRC 16547 TaxID=3030993 RepID=UPI0024A1209A|nr:dipeptide epimerase [Microtetraspora sp. NBRC 16547]GLX02382.1 mandelate racemase [Microtetraspora sp. NBRC 16547]
MKSLVVERVETFVVELPSIRSFSISGGSVTTAGKPAERVLVKVTAGGLTGWGEATPTPAWTYETVESISTTIHHYLAPALLGRPAWDLDGACATYEKVINRGLTIGSPIAKSALDIALHDLLGRALGVSVGVVWGQRRVDRIKLGWIVAGQTPAEVRQAVEEGRAQGYQAYKVKVGLHDEATDVSVVAAVREAAPDAPIWVDANQAYTVDGALRMARRLVDLDVSAFEQPLPANDITGLRRLRDHSPLPVALDESLRHPSDMATFVKLDAVDIAIAKVQRSGGLTLSRRLCQLAEDAGLRIMGSGLTDTDLGFAASLHLFAAFGVDTPVDLNGRQFVHSAYVGGSTVEVVDGTALVPTGPGLGVEVDEDAVRALSTAHWSL